MNINTMTRKAASVSEQLRPQAQAQFRLLPVPSPALPAWNARVAAWARAA